MAESQLGGLQDEITCSVCLDNLTDPVTIPCGHSFCLKCLTDCWDQSQECSCPQCRHVFMLRPELKRNTLLNEVVKKLKKTALSSLPSKNFASLGDVECDFCTGKKFRAVKSCLTCLASFCQIHLQPHYEVATWKGHKLTDPDRNLKEKLCEKHQKSLEMFCRTDKTYICMMCGMTEHNSHEKVELKTEREGKQKQMGATLREIRRRLEEKEKKLRETRKTAEEMKISVERMVEEHDKSFTALIWCIEEANKKLTEKIREQEKIEMEKAEGVMKQLEKEIDELKRREAELKELSETNDHLHFLQVRVSLHRVSEQTRVYFCPLTLDINTAHRDLRLSEGNKKVTCEWTKAKYPNRPDRFDYWRQVLCREALTGTRCYWEVECSGDELEIGVAYKGLERKGEGEECGLGYNDKSWCLQWTDSEYSVSHNNEEIVISAPYSPRIDFCPLTLDINTAHRDLHLSEGNKKVTHKGTKAKYPDHPDRFDCWSQVLCREGLTGTRCYWEVECSGDLMMIGVAYKGLSRKGRGRECSLGNNNKSWSLLSSHSQYSVWHNNKETEISAPYSPRIGVYLDWSAGSLSFYSVSHTMTLLHRFNTSFTEPLYPGFWLDPDCSVKISHLTPCDH
ncbi:TRI47 protein, partial [Polypterus senegalus]